MKLPEKFKTPNVLDPSKGFKLYLKSQGVSPITIKNYLSDFSRFWGWLILSLKSRGNTPSVDIISQISLKIINDYKSFLLNNHHPISTINRQLSTLRKFGQFCLLQGWTKNNPAREVANIHPVHLQGVSSRHLPSVPSTSEMSISRQKILKNFQKQLEKERASPITIKNYLSDIRHFLSFIEHA